MEYIAILLLALVMDFVFGEPSRVFHLTVWTGKLVDFFSRFGLSLSRPAWQFIYGALMTLFIIALFPIASYVLLDYLSDLSTVLYILVAAFLLKTTFCLRDSARLSIMVRDYLTSSAKGSDKVPKDIRFLLTTVEYKKDDSKEVSVASSTIRSLFENSSDFLVGPLFYYLILGVPGALAYRAANILDGMIGHHGEYEYLGKFAAHLDDILSYIPARLTVLFTVLAAAITKGSAVKTWRVALADHGKTESMNAGWTMAAAAGALGVQLERVGYYTLGIAEQPLTAATITEAVRLFVMLAIVLIIIFLTLLSATTLIF
jgi:adenosylcobinamide-phosphate synthase